MKSIMRPVFLLLTAMLLSGGLVSAEAGDRLTVRINGYPISAWRTSALDSAKKEAAQEHKPIAWVAASPDWLDGTGGIASNGSKCATLHALQALRDQTVLVFEDGFAENHKVLQLVDDAVHTENGKYIHHPILPVVVFLNPRVTKVIAEVNFEPDFVKRSHIIADALKQAKANIDTLDPLYLPADFGN